MIRTDRIGDVILTLPMIDTLKQNYPNSRIDFLVNKRVSELISEYPNINKVHAIEKDSLRDIRRICKENKYDLAIVVRPLFKIALALFLSGIKYRLGTGYRWYSFLFNIRHYRHRKFSIKHELEYNLDLLGELGCKRPDNIAPVLEIEDRLIKEVKNKLGRKGIELSKEFIILHPGTLGSARSWKPANFAGLINLIASDKTCNFNILITGTNSDEPVLNDVVSNIKSADNVYVIDDFNLKEFAGLIKLASLFVSNSTGPIHIAAAVGTFCIGFYSPVTVETAARWGPYTERRKIFSPPATESSNPDAMDKIVPEEVFDFMKNFMSNEKLS